MPDFYLQAHTIIGISKLKGPFCKIINKGGMSRRRSTEVYYRHCSGQFH